MYLDTVNIECMECKEGYEGIFFYYCVGKQKIPFKKLNIIFQKHDPVGKQQILSVIVFVLPKISIFKVFSCLITTN